MPHHEDDDLAENTTVFLRKKHEREAAEATTSSEALDAQRRVREGGLPTPETRVSTDMGTGNPPERVMRLPLYPPSPDVLEQAQHLADAIEQGGEVVVNYSHAQVIKRVLDVLRIRNRELAESRRHKNSSGIDMGFGG